MKRMMLLSTALGMAVVASTWPSATAAPIGGGAFTGTLTYGGAGIPPAPACVDMTFQVSLQATMAVSVGLEAFAGSVTIQGNGQTGYDYDACESVSGGAGAISLSVLGIDAAGSELRCDDLFGYWGRNAVQGLFAHADGTCAVNGAVADGVSLGFRGAWVPSSVTGNVTSASVAGDVEYLDRQAACDLPAAGHFLCTAPSEWLPQP